MATSKDTDVLRRLGGWFGFMITLAGLAGILAGVSAAADLQLQAPNNKGVVELETTGSAGTSICIAEDLASVVDDGATRRVLPVVGRSTLQILWDIAFLRGIDMGILQADVLDGARQRHALSGAENGITYIIKLNNEEFHLLARPEVNTIADLANQKVNVDVRGSGTVITAERLFALLNVPFQPTNDSQEVALERLRSGEIAAMAFVAGKPASIFQRVRRDEGLHFLAIPLNPSVINAYVPVTLDSNDYPVLIQNDHPIDTVAVATLLAVADLQPGSERYRNVQNFVDVFFTGFKLLLEPGHNLMWGEINLAAEVPGWRRFPPAQQWLDRAPPSPSELRERLRRCFLGSSMHARGWSAGHL